MEMNQPLAAHCRFPAAQRRSWLRAGRKAGSSEGSLTRKGFMDCSLTRFCLPPGRSALRISSSETIGALGTSICEVCSSAIELKPAGRAASRALRAGSSWGQSLRIFWFDRPVIAFQVACGAVPPSCRPNAEIFPRADLELLGATAAGKRGQARPWASGPSTRYRVQ